jgi:carbon storage regulator
MLVLSRKEQESIRIGEGITVVVGRISGGKVSLMIDAPASVPVHREEIWQRVQQEGFAFSATPNEAVLS